MVTETKVQAGFQLDFLIAEKVFGWKRPDSIPIAPHMIVEYSTDIAAAWEVVEHFNGPARDGRCVAVAKTEPDYWTCEIGGRDDEPEGVSHIGVADTAPLSICRAALAAVKVP